jgi:hypothetical protein
MSTGLQNLSLQAGQDLHDVTGIYPASLGAKSNETSGVAIRARQHEGDTGSNYIPDNTKRAIAYCGRILCDLIPKIYDNERIVSVLKESGEHELAGINLADDPETSLDDGGEYSVVVSTGPSYLTRQQEMADTMVELVRSMPIIGEAAPDLLVKALGFPGGDEIAERVMPPQFRKDKDGNPVPTEPTAEDVESAAKAEKAKAEAEGTTIDNLQKLFGMLQAIEGVPQQMAAMSDQLSKLTGAQQQPNAGQPAPQGPAPAPNGAAPPDDVQMLEPLGAESESELEPMGAPV